MKEPGETLVITRSDDCQECGFRPRKADKYFVEDYQVTHVICYGCGMEWVE